MHRVRLTYPDTRVILVLYVVIFEYFASFTTFLHDEIKCILLVVIFEYFASFTTFLHDEIKCILLKQAVFR